MQRGEARKRQWIKRRINRNHSCCSCGSVWSAAGRRGIGQSPDVFQTASKVKMKRDIVESLANTSSRVAAALGGEGRRRRRAPNLYCRELLFFYQTEGGEKGFLSLYVFGNGRSPPPLQGHFYLSMTSRGRKKDWETEGGGGGGRAPQSKKRRRRRPFLDWKSGLFSLPQYGRGATKCHHFRKIKQKRLYFKDQWNVLYKIASWLECQPEENCLRRMIKINCLILFFNLVCSLQVLRKTMCGSRIFFISKTPF